ncbi:hypothetical protein MRX96_024268 [Rhipicephalus microplus]
MPASASRLGLALAVQKRAAGSGRPGNPPHSGRMFLRRRDGRACNLSVLLSVQKIGPWYLFRSGDSPPHIDYHSLLIDVSRAMQSFTVQPVFFGTLSYTGMHHGCIISNFMDPTTRTWETVFVVPWSGQPFAAASVKTNEQQQTLLTSLHIALSDEGVELLDGLYAHLENAYRAGCRCPNMGALALLRHDRDPSIAMRLLPDGHPLVQAEE